MKIVFENNNGVLYEEIKPGETFLFDDEVFIKADIKDESGRMMAVNCSSGAIVYFVDKGVVVPANCELHII